MRKYEIMYIIRSNIEKDAMNLENTKIKEIFAKNNSQVLEFSEWGIKDLAYEIEHMKKGYYVNLKVNATIEAIDEFNRVVGYDENIIRHIVIKLEK